MATRFRVYIRADDPATAEAILREYPAAKTERGTTYYDSEYVHDGWDVLEEKLCTLSARLETDILCLYYQTVVNAFEFHHWDRGICVRSLVFGSRGPEEVTWERVEGKAEAWERDAIFSARELAYWLGCSSGDDAREYERLWEAAELRPGQTKPLIDERRTAKAIAVHYRLPGWGEDWYDSAGVSTQPYHA